MREDGLSPIPRGMASSPPVSAQGPGIRIFENQVINREVVLPDLSLSEGKNEQLKLKRFELKHSLKDILWGKKRFVSELEMNQHLAGGPDFQATKSDDISPPCSDSRASSKCRIWGEQPKQNRLCTHQAIISSSYLVFTGWFPPMNPFNCIPAPSMLNPLKYRLSGGESIPSRAFYSTISRKIPSV